MAFCSIPVVVPSRLNAALGVGMKIFYKPVAFIVMAMSFGNHALGLSLSFESEDSRFDAATHEYREIWSADGARIEKLLEETTGVSLGDEQITVVVFKGISSSGVTGEAIHLRATYPLSVKRGTLVHELSHRYVDALNLDSTCYNDVHDIVSLVLLDVWAKLWGRNFVEEQVEVEMVWSTRYAEAWAGVLGMSKTEQRKKLELVLSSCRGPTEHSSRLRSRIFVRFKPG